MKKIILTLGLLAIASASSFAQGSFVFSTASRYVWDDWSSVTPRVSASNNVAFLFATGSPVSLAGSGSVTNNSGAMNYAAAWTAILTDPNYHLATNSADGTLAVVQTSGLGTIAYNGGNPFTVAGTSASGGAVSIFVIGWSSLYANPFLAAAANSVVGWSSVFSYAYTPGPIPGPAGTPGNFSGLLTPFGVGTAVPEPTTLALAGLGAASLLIFRRRK
ncbi:MAG TPA: PEP-CTERM sorting domain-containing protein [Candidatus Saccharimonadales bacterium]